MTTLYDHIQMLRTELRSCHLTRRERMQVEAELAIARAEQVQRDTAFDLAARSDDGEPP